MVIDNGEVDGAAKVAPSDRPGDVLKRAREERGLTLAAVAEQTRVPIRQLEAVERNDFGALPGTPYAVGFARAYARAVGANEVTVAQGVRYELGAAEPSERYEAFEPLDPAHVPPRWLAWIAAGIAALLLVGYGVWRAHLQVVPTDAELSAPAAPVASTTRPTPAAAVPTSGPVVLTAINAVWLRIYDQNGTRLLEKELAKGESYTVPANASNPMILTGRPDALSVTVGGKAVAPLGPPNKTVVDLPVSAAALLSRPAAPAATPAPNSAPPSAAATEPALPASPANAAVPADR